MQVERPVREVESSQPTQTQPDNQREQEAKEFIFFKESSNRLDAVNHIGCKGLGQDCNQRLHIECPNWETDRGCQEEFWHGYMSRRYGSWQKAKDHWLARVPINGRDVGHWW